MRCAQCYHDLHTGEACPSCGCRSAPVGSPYNPWVPDVVVEAENVVVETESQVAYCGHGNDERHCHMCSVSSNFRSLAMAIFLLIGFVMLALFIDVVIVFWLFVAFVVFFGFIW